MSDNRLVTQSVVLDFNCMFTHPTASNLFFFSLVGGRGGGGNCMSDTRLATASVALDYNCMSTHPTSTDLFIL